ncbi:TlpA disulfide reductase family protein [Mucilaginibacter sp. CSA2-8R]|uniref:TlpA family protein disulfide reductase n=1 Tax=Mucilaginibacter sp. CSA2-8R TaxID=3141542 RepID=UPI00315D2D7A
MKKGLLYLILAAFGLVAKAQTNSITKRVTLNESSIIKDENGVIYPYLVWSRLTRTGDYSIKALKQPNTDSISYVLVKLTNGEKEILRAQLPKPNESENFKVGDMLRPFKDKDITNEKIDTKKLLGKVIVLNFWFINCPPCRQEIPDLNELADSYKNNPDVLFVAIALDEAYDIKQFIKKQPFNYHIIENGRYHADKYKLHLYPTNVVIDKAGKIAFSSVSFNMGNTHWMKKAINEALADQTKQAAL